MRKGAYERLRSGHSMPWRDPSDRVDTYDGKDPVEVADVPPTPTPASQSSVD